MAGTWLLRDRASGERQGPKKRPGIQLEVAKGGFQWLWWRHCSVMDGVSGEADHLLTTTMRKMANHCVPVPGGLEGAKPCVPLNIGWERCW